MVADSDCMGLELVAAVAEHKGRLGQAAAAVNA